MYVRGGWFPTGEEAAIFRHRLGLDPEELARAAIDPGTLRRAWGFARRYRARMLLYLATIIAAALIGIVPPLIFKELIDRAIPNRDVGLVDLLFAAAVGLALFQTGLGLVNRWYASAIGEGLIFDLRVELFEHVQRQPVAFFTRTQTGALLSRLSNDVVGAQQTVSTLASVISDVFTLAFTLAAMVAFSWQVTLLSLVVVPGIVLLDRRLGRRLAALSRQRMTLNADMTTTMTERFNVAGAMLVKLFGRPRAEAREFASRAGQVRDSGIQLAVTGRIYYGSLALLGALGTAAVYWLGGRAVIRGGLTIGALTALAAHRPGQRPCRPAHRPRLLRTGLRGPRPGPGRGRGAGCPRAGGRGGRGA